MSQVVKMRSFDVIETHDRCQRVEDLRRCRPRLILLDPRVVTDAHSCQPGQFLAP